MTELCNLEQLITELLGLSSEQQDKIRKKNYSEYFSLCKIALMLQSDEIKKEY